jgi:hypothetical protein
MEEEVRLFTLVIALVTAASVVAASAPHQALHGSLQIRGATIVDAPKEEPKNTHAAFSIDGGAAKMLYDALPGKPVEDECLADGSLGKRAGNLACVRRHDGKYECDFAIDLRSQTIEPGRVC